MRETSVIVLLGLLRNLAPGWGWSLWDYKTQFTPDNYRSAADPNDVKGKADEWYNEWINLETQEEPAIDRSMYAGVDEWDFSKWKFGPRRGHTLVRMKMDQVRDCTAGGTLSEPLATSACDPGVYIVLFGGRAADGVKKHIPKTYDVKTNEEDGTLNITTYDQKPVNPCLDTEGVYFAPEERENCDAADLVTTVPVAYIYNDVWAYKVWPHHRSEDFEEDGNPTDCMRDYTEACEDSGWILWHPGAQQGGCVYQLGQEVCSVPSERYEHAASAFNDGAMYIYGGFSQRCRDFCDDMWFFDIFLKGWREIYPAGKLSRFYYAIDLSQQINLETIEGEFLGLTKGTISDEIFEQNGGQYYRVPNVYMDTSDIPNAGPGKRWKHTMTGDGNRTFIFGGHRLWHGFSRENEQANDWSLYNELPGGGYLNDLWQYDKTLDFDVTPGETFKSAKGQWKELRAACDLTNPNCVWPGERAGHGSVLDEKRGLVWIFGGYRTYFPYLKTDGQGSGAGLNALQVGGFVPYPQYDYYLRDLWYYTVSTGLWTEVRPVKVQVIKVTAFTPGMPLNPNIKFALVFRYLESRDATLLSVAVSRECISITATAEEVREALVTLDPPVISDISVVRSGGGNFKYPYTFEWRVFFRGNAQLGELSAHFGTDHGCSMSQKEVMETLVGNALLHIVPDTFDGGCLLEMDENYGGNLLVRMMPGDSIVLQITTKLSEYGPQATEYIKTVYSVEEKSVTYSKSEWDNCGFPGENIIRVFVKSNILLSVSTEEDKTPAPRSEMTMVMVNEKSRDSYGQDVKIDSEGYLIIHGGYANNHAYDDVWYFDVTTSRWLEKETFVTPLYPDTCTDDTTFVTKTHDEVIARRLDAWHEIQHSLDGVIRTAEGEPETEAHLAHPEFKEALAELQAALTDAMHAEKGRNVNDIDVSVLRDSMRQVVDKSAVLTSVLESLEMADRRKADDDEDAAVRAGMTLSEMLRANWTTKALVLEPRLDPELFCLQQVVEDSSPSDQEALVLDDDAYEASVLDALKHSQVHAHVDMEEGLRDLSSYWPDHENPPHWSVRDWIHEELSEGEDEDDMGGRESDLDWDMQDGATLKLMEAIHPPSSKRKNPATATKKVNFDDGEEQGDGDMRPTVWKLYHDDNLETFEREHGRQHVDRDGRPIERFDTDHALRRQGLVRKVYQRLANDSLAFRYESCSSVASDPVRETGAVLPSSGPYAIGRRGRKLETVSIKIQRRRAPGWNGCDTNIYSTGKEGLTYLKPTNRFSHAAVYIPDSREIFMVGGMGYKQEQLPSITDTWETEVKDDMWQYNMNYCANNCSEHGKCEYGFCFCNYGYYGIDCSNSSCPGTACYYDSLTHEERCQHACQSSYNHTEIDEYVQDAVKVPCSRELPGEENGVCDGFGQNVCLPGFIGSDCSVRDCPADEDGRKCSLNGWCSVEFPVSRCMCNAGFYGEVCEFQECLNNCSYPNGVCNIETGLCSCRMRYNPYINSRSFHPWEGEDCSFLAAWAAAPRVLQNGFGLILVIVLLTSTMLMVLPAPNFAGADVGLRDKRR